MSGFVMMVGVAAIAVVVGTIGVMLRITLLGMNELTLSTTPIEQGENWGCPICGSFWYYSAEEVHFKDCIAGIARQIERVV